MSLIKWHCQQRSISKAPLTTPFMQLQTQQLFLVRWITITLLIRIRRQSLLMLMTGLFLTQPIPIQQILILRDGEQRMSI
jgi:hypothetical protein